MKAMSTYIIAIVLLLAFVIPAQAQHGWIAVPSGTTQALKDVTFTSPLVGTVVGQGSTILRTSNGGAAWVSQGTLTGIWYDAVTFANDSVGLICGDGGTILFTQSSGTAWTTVQTGDASTFYGAQQLTSDLGMVVGNNAIFTALGAVSTTGWQTQTNFSWYIRHDSTNYEGSAWDVVMLSPTRALSAMSVWPSNGAITLTTDAGQSWTTALWVDGHSVMALDFPTSNIGYAVGAGGMFTKSTDSGSTWSQPVSLLEDVTLWDVKFANTDTGWAVGDGGIIIRTDDGGAHWHSLNCPVSTNLYAVDFVNTNIGYVVGQSGRILKTTNGGEPNRAPGSFTRLFPEDDSTFFYLSPAPVTFRWSSAHDPDGDSVRYHVQVDVNSHHLSFLVSDTVLTDSLIGIWDNIIFQFTWSVYATDGTDSTEASNGTGHFAVYLPDAADDQPYLPVVYNLTSYPNPFNPVTTISISLPREAKVALRVFDVTGREVLKETEQLLPAGEHRLPFDGSALPSGVYFARLESPLGVRTAKMMLLK
jgi:photosystem II stability/assembly factor-like uncharacterized protein